MQSVFGFSDYRTFINAWIFSRPGGGKGERLRLAKAAKVHPSLISQVLGGAKELTQEQAYAIGRHCGLEGAEREYFLDLIQRARAADPDFKSWLDEKLRKARSRWRPEHDSGELAVLSEHDKGIFYSAWYYSAAHLMTALPGRRDTNRLAKQIGLPVKTVQEVLNFLVATGLCISDRGQIRIGLQKTQIQDASTHLDRFLTNWRMRGIEKVPTSQPPQFFHSQQLYLSASDVARTRELLVRVSEEIGNMMEKTRPEVVYCLNIDWFNVLNT